MPIYKRFPHLFVVVLVITVLSLVACAQSGSDATPATVEEAENVAPGPTATSEPAGTNQAPVTLQVQAALMPAIDPSCIPAGDGFNLHSVALPAQGLQPGMDHLFCAVGAPEGETVTFTLIDPNGDERTFRVESIRFEDTTVAPLRLRLAADDIPGDWTLQAKDADGSNESEIALKVMAATQPFIALREPLMPDVGLIKAAVGGLPPESVSRFALYSLADPRAATGEQTAYDGVLLISTRLVADASGRADLELDVADLPSGAYLLLLLPPGADLGSPPTLKLPDQARLAVTTNLIRTTQVADVSGSQPELSGPVPAEAGGGLPEIVQLNIAPGELPACPQAETPILNIYPNNGEIGDWWYGCAGGFAPGETLKFTVSLANGRTSQFEVTVKADGTAPFRWYSFPNEGSGLFAIQGQAPSGQAETSWEIAVPSRPHALVFPHEYQTTVGGSLILTGFPERESVDLGLYRITDQGLANKVKEWQVTTDGQGTYNRGFTQSFGLSPGQYLLVAQSQPVFNFPDINLPASAVEFFSYNSPLDERHDVYTLHLGRTDATAIAAVPTSTPVSSAGEEAPPSADATATPLATPTAAAPPTPEVPPQTISIAEDTSPPPTCPDAVEGTAALCLLPTTLPQGTFAYLIMHDFQPGTRFNVVVTQPNGNKVPLTTRVADDNGFADAHWYALDRERTGEYKVRVRAGNDSFNGAFTITEATTPNIVAQPRSPKPGTPVIVSLTGFSPNEELILAQYRSPGPEQGQVNFNLVGKQEIKTNKNGTARQTYNTNRRQRGDLFMIAVFQPDNPTPVTQVIYRPGVDLGVQYPFAWGQNYQEGQ